jgi:hypothetical protein
LVNLERKVRRVNRKPGEPYYVSNLACSTRTRMKSQDLDELG